MGHGDRGLSHSNYLRSGGSSRQARLLSGIAVALHRGVQGPGTYLPVFDWEVYRAPSGVCADLIHVRMEMWDVGSGLTHQVPKSTMRAWNATFALSVKY